MNLLRRHLTLSPLAALVGCASPHVLHNGEALKPGVAHVLVHPRYVFDRRVPDEVDIGLARLDGGKIAEDFGLSTVPNNEVSVIEVPPGFYFLRRLHIDRGGYQHTFEPLKTLFVARANQINYPGDWFVRVERKGSEVSGTLGGGTITTQYLITAFANESKDVPVKLQARYPDLNAKLPLRATRVTET